MNELTYTRCGDYYIPDLKLSEQPEAPIGKYGRMRQRYLKEHRPGLYSSLILSEMLYPHLLEIDRAARERIDAIRCLWKHCKRKHTRSICWMFSCPAAWRNGLPLSPSTEKR